MKPLLLMLACLFFLAACSKKDKDGTDACPTGKLRFNNTSSSSYKIYLDDNYLSIVTGGAFKEYDVPKGDHKMKAVQESGPGYKEGQCTIAGCDNQKFLFP